MKMTPKERFLSVLSFEQPDRIPIMDFGYWPETIEAWKQQGLPKELETYEEVESFFYGDRGFELNMVNRWCPAGGSHMGHLPALRADRSGGNGGYHPLWRRGRQGAGA